MSTLYSNMSAASNKANEKLNNSEINLKSKDFTSTIPIISSSKIKRTIDEHHKKSKLIRNRNYNYTKSLNQKTTNFNFNKDIIQKNLGLENKTSLDTIFNTIQSNFNNNNNNNNDDGNKNINDNCQNSLQKDNDNINDKDTLNNSKTIIKYQQDDGIINNIFEHNLNSKAISNLPKFALQNNNSNNNLNIPTNINSIQSDIISSSTYSIIKDYHSSIKEIKDIKNDKEEKIDKEKKKNDEKEKNDEKKKNDEKENDEKENDEKVNKNNNEKQNDGEENNSNNKNSLSNLSSPMSLSSSSDSSDRNSEEEEALIRDIEISLSETENDIDNEINISIVEDNDNSISNNNDDDNRSDNNFNSNNNYVINDIEISNSSKSYQSNNNEFSNSEGNSSMSDSSLKEKINQFLLENESILTLGNINQLLDNDLDDINQLLNGNKNIYDYLNIDQHSNDDTVETSNEEIINSVISSGINSLHLNDNINNRDNNTILLNSPSNLSVNPFEINYLNAEFSFKYDNEIKDKPNSELEHKYQENQNFDNLTKNEIINDQQSRNDENNKKIQKQGKEIEGNDKKEEKFQKKQIQIKVNDKENEKVKEKEKIIKEKDIGKKNLNNNCKNDGNLLTLQEGMKLQNIPEIVIPRSCSVDYIKEREQTPSPPDRITSHHFSSSIKSFTIPKIIDTPLYYSTTLSSDSSSSESNNHNDSHDGLSDQSIEDSQQSSTSSISVHSTSTAITPSSLSNSNNGSTIIVRRYKDKSNDTSSKKSLKVKNKKLRPKSKLNDVNSLRKEILKRSFQHENDKNELSNKRIKLENKISNTISLMKQQSAISVVNSNANNHNHDNDNHTHTHKHISKETKDFISKSTSSDTISRKNSLKNSTTSSMKKSSPTHDKNSKIKKPTSSPKGLNDKLLKKIASSSSIDSYVQNLNSSSSRNNLYIPVGIALKKEQGIITKHGVIPFQNDKSKPIDIIHHEIPILNDSPNSIEKYMSSSTKKIEDNDSKSMQLIIPASHPKKSIKNYNQLTLNSSILKTNLNNNSSTINNNIKIPSSTSSQTKFDIIINKSDANSSTTNNAITDTPLTYLRNSRKNLVKYIKNSIKKQSGKIQQTKSTAERKGLVVQKNKLVRKKKWLKSV